MAKRNGGAVGLEELIAVMAGLGVVTRVNGKNESVAPEEILLAMKPFDAISSDPNGAEGRKSLDTIKATVAALDPDKLDTIVVLTLSLPTADEWCESCGETHEANSGVINGYQSIGDKEAVKLMLAIALNNVAKSVSIDDFLREKTSRDHEADNGG